MHKPVFRGERLPSTLRGIQDMVADVRRASHEIEEAACEKRIENADFDILVGAQRQDLTIARDVVAVVEQHAYANAALRRAQDTVHDHLASVVVLNDEVLQIQRALGRAGQFGS